jgi:Mg-chelatase subunit ChlD
VRNSNWQQREAARIAVDNTLETATDAARERRAREIREENIRRTKAAQA